MLSLAVLVAGWGQQQKPPVPGEGDFVFRSETRVVVCHTTVTDKSGRLITDLPKEVFTVFENGVPQEIKVFKREDVPVSMGLIIDNSTDSRGQTAMRDAVQMSINHLRLKAHRDKKVLVLVTDGEDNVSAVKMEDLVKAAQQSDVLIYCVGLLGDEEPLAATRARRALEELANATGGESFFPDDASQVDRIAHQVARDIRNQYTIEYTPSNTAMDGTFRRIEIVVNAPGKPLVRTRSGYYATPGQMGGGK
jgi:hypothetical protein